MRNPGLWQPDAERIEQSQLYRFMQQVNSIHHLQLSDYAGLHQWSVQHSDQFWSLLWEEAGVIGSRGDIVVADPEDLEKARWFPDACLNFAENLLRETSDEPAIISYTGSLPRSVLSWNELSDRVSKIARYLKNAGIKKGDRVAAIVSNCPETVIAMLASTSLGAIWTSVSPDFGESSILERFEQTTPRLLFSIDGYTYKGKSIDVTAKAASVMAAIPAIERVVTISHYGNAIANSDDWQTILETIEPEPIEFQRVGFNDPLFIMYSSGTTGKPKCIVHCTGGVLLQHLKEHRLHCDIRKSDRVFYYTTCGWMMWNWIISVLASNATLVTYDEAPDYPEPYRLFELVQEEGLSLFGTSASFLNRASKMGLRPVEKQDLDSLRMICSTGSVLPPESFDYVYDAIKRDVCLASISGGTDILSCFVLGNPMQAVYRGECQAIGLALDVRAFDDAGQPVTEEKGELVCLNSFPVQPLGFWGDDGQQRYHDAYFSSYENVWCHGDFIEITANNGVVFYGRSDATLNPGGVRLGTAEIYRYVEQLAEVEESIAIGQNWQDDVRVVLFVKLQQGLVLDEELLSRIRQTIRINCSPRHVPAKVLAVTDIPRTKSGKIVELAVREAVHNRPVKYTGSLQNPEALEQFKNRMELES
jgi:acetoacetyl-CoA synthetase